MYANFGKGETHFCKFMQINNNRYFFTIVTRSENQNIFYNFITDFLHGHVTYADLAF